MTDRERLLEASLDQIKRYGRKRGEVWRHYKGGLYVVLGECLKEDDLTIMIVYQDVATGRTWCRPKHEWQQIVYPNDGAPPSSSVRRFEPTHNTLDI